MKSNSVTIIIIAIGDNRGGGGRRDGVKVLLIINYTRTLSPKGHILQAGGILKGRDFTS